MPADDKGSDLGRVEDATRQLAVNLANLEHGILSPFQTQLLLSGDLNRDLSNYQSASGRGVEHISKDVDRQLLSLWASLDVLIAEITRLREKLNVNQEQKPTASQTAGSNDALQSVPARKGTARPRKYGRRGGRAPKKR
jgi:hypothetical protein